MAAIRRAVPADYDWIIEVVDEWWGRPIGSALPRLFLDHFATTSLIAEDEGRPVGFLVGLFSPTSPSEAYIHFVGVDPNHRGHSLGRDLYEAFLAAARADGRTEVSAITAPVNRGSIDFHRSLGFSVSEPIVGYNGAGTALVRFHRLI